MSDTANEDKARRESFLMVADQIHKTVRRKTVTLQSPRDLTELAKALNEGYFKADSSITVIGHIESLNVESSGTTERDEYRERLDNHEKRITILEQASTKLDGLAKSIVVDSFSSIPFVTRLFVVTNLDVFTVFVVYEDSSPREVRKIVVQKEIDLRKRFPQLRFDFIPIESSGGKIPEFYRAQEIYSRRKP